MFRTRRFQSPAIFCKVVGGGGWATLIPQSGLVNAWPYDTANTTSGTATDVIGGKNSTQTSVTLNGSGPSANLNNAAVFNGTTSHGDTALANLPTAAFSIVMWINTSNAGGIQRAISTGTTSVTNNGFDFLIGTGNNLYYLGNGSAFGLFGSGGYSAATWTMFTLTYDGTNVKSYLNTTLASTTAFTGPLTSGAHNISFGFNPDGSGFYTGMLAGVAFYNRALSSGEITTINGL